MSAKWCCPRPWIIKETHGNFTFSKERQNIKKEMKVPLILPIKLPIVLSTM